MLELGISQAQTQFTKLLNKSVLIIDKKAQNKKAVILPYKEYKDLLSKASSNQNTKSKSSFSKFIGILDNDFKDTDIKYNEIMK
jgi:hypothetical protein